MYNPLLKLTQDFEAQQNDLLVALRQEIESWLSKPNRTQQLLASRAGISYQMLNDVIKCRRGCSPDTFESIVKALKNSNPSGVRFTKIQTLGRPLKGDLNLDVDDARAAHTKNLQ